MSALGLIADMFALPEHRAEALIEAAEPLWNELAELGWTDGYGGMEFERVFPPTLAYIRQQANVGPDG
jgi:hypothetical protein